MADQVISKKIHNYNYAPGIATYGKIGNTGDDGLNGNTMFYTNFNIADEEGLTGIASQIKLGYLPLKDSTVSANRDYQDGDLFLTAQGFLYTLRNIEELVSKSSARTAENMITSDYFQLVAKILPENTGNDMFEVNNLGRLVFNTANYKGFDITKTSAELEDTDVALRIASEDIDKNNDINLILLNAINKYNVTDGDLKIYYNTNDKSFHISSDLIIQFNGNVKVNNAGVKYKEDLDSYSSILTSKDTIAMFKFLCDSYVSCTFELPASSKAADQSIKLVLTIRYDEAGYVLKIMDKLRKSLMVKLYIENNCYMYQVAAGTRTDGANSEIYRIPLSSYIDAEVLKQVLATSLVYNTEIFVKHKLPS